MREAVDNAIKHNTSSTPAVEIRVTDRSEEWIDIEIEDNGPGIPDREIDVLDEGETRVYHADRLGIWLIYWIVSLAGGTLSVSNLDPRGTLLELAVPKNPHLSV